MITGKNNIIAYFEQCEKPYFAVFYKGQVEKGNTIVRNDKEEKDYDFADGKRRFENCLELLTHGEYTIIIAADKDVTKRGNNRVDFKIPVNESTATTTPPVNGIGSIGVSMEEVEARALKIADERFTRLMEQQELKNAKEKLAALEKENRELEKAKTDPWNKLVGALAPHSEHIVAGLFGNKANVAPLTISGAVPDAEGAAPDNQTIFQNFVDALAAARPNDWQAVLVKLTDAIQATPEKIDLLLKFI